MRNLRDKFLKIGVIADDLTGANDTGVQFRKSGLTTICLVGIPKRETPPEADAIVLDTESRNKPRDEARRLASQAATALKDMGARLFYKKIDSTMRGNIGVEIEAIMDALGVNTTILTPAYPARGRVVMRGHLLVHGVPLEETEYPTEISAGPQSLQTLLGASITRPSTHVDIETVLRGGKRIASEIAQKISADGGIFTIDASSRSDLAAIAWAAHKLGMRFICGSAGLAEEIPYAYGLVKSVGPVLAVVGSPSPTSIKQLNEASRTPNVAAVNLDASKLFLGKKTSAVEAERVTDQLANYLKRKVDSVLSSARSEADLDAPLSAGLRKGLTETEVRTRVAQSLSKIVITVIEESPVSGLFVTGGETAVHILKALQAEGTEIIKEISPGIPVVKLQGGKFAGLNVVTKAGGFGDDYSIVDAIRYLRTGSDPN